MQRAFCHRSFWQFELCEPRPRVAGKRWWKTDEEEGKDAGSFRSRTRSAEPRRSRRVFNPSSRHPFGLQRVIKAGKRVNKRQPEARR
jgi:hypothetical protein